MTRIVSGMRREVEVAIALVHRGNHWLVARRRPEAHLGGLWEFPGGKREGVERPAETALRELREECAVEAVVEAELETLRHDYGDRVVSLTPLVCRWRSGEGVPHGCEECRWATLGEISGLPMPALNAEIIHALERHVRRGAGTA